MLLPSDVARLVLGYLQQENLTSTCQAFILESSNLKEYAEHCTDEGFIPACLLSLFGKNLTTILNEYVAMKAKETSNDVPAILSSLWKKLDHTLSQIRSMQSSPGFAANQRARTRSGIAEIKRQRRLASQAAPVSSELLTLPYLSGQFTNSPLTATQVIRPTGQISTPLRSNFVVVNHSQSQDTMTPGEALNIIPGPQERKTHASLMSPGRRKSESQRKTITLSGPHSTIRNFQDPNTFAVEKQMVIENAREKILSNKSLQEKLAENINKFLTSDNNIAQVPKQTDSNPSEPETSIDELLGLQVWSEIHMSEEAIQDILEQTESDPAFQALFDLFDYGKTKNNKNISQGISSQHMETNLNVVLAGETNLAVKGSFETEESDDQSGQPPFCTSYQNEDTSNVLKNGSNHDELRQEAQEHFSQIDSSIQKKAFKTVVSTEQKCNLDITFESVPNLNDFNQRVNSDAECNQHCAELYTSQMSTETELAMEGEKNSLSPSVQNESRLQPDQSEIPITSFVSLGGETNNENLILSGKTSQLLSQNIPLTGKPSKKGQFCESSDDTRRLTTNFHGSKSPDSREIHQSKIEINNVLPVASQQLSDCQDNSSLQSKILPVSIEGSGLTVSEQKVEIHLGNSVSSIKQPSNDSSSVELNHTDHEPQPSKSEKVALGSQEPSSSVKEDGDSIFLSLGENNCEEVTLIPPEANPIEDIHSLPSESVCSSMRDSHPESQNTSDKPAGNKSTEIDASNIVSLKIIISDDPFVSSDSELNSAVSSISGENLPTIILSSPAKSPARNAELVKCLSSEETTGAVSSAEGIGDSASMEQSLLALKPEDSTVNNTQNEDSIAFSANVTPCVSKDGGYIQLMPATSTTFGNSNNILIATCVTDPTALGTTVSQSNVVVLPGNSAPMTAQPPPQLQTPPRSNSVFAVNQAMSPSFSQGSAIIIASPVQPVLQGMVGMIPVSVVGQNANMFSASPRQVLHMPLAAPVCNRSIPQFPIPPKSLKTQGLRNKPCTGKQVNNLMDSSSHLVGCHVQRTEVPDKNMATDLGKKLEEITVPFSVESIVPTSKTFESHRRVLCFDSTASPVANTQGTNHKTVSQNKERNDISFSNLDSPIVSSTLKPPSNNALKREREKPPVPKILSKSETAISRHTIKETQSEKKVSPTETILESFHKATANKENELCSDVETQKNPETSKLSNGQQNGGVRNEKTIASLQELTRKQGTSSNSKNVISVGAPVKDLKQEQTKSASSLINPLTKHTTEMLQDIQWHSPVNRLADSTDLSVPRTSGSGAGEKHKEEPTDVIKVPSSRRYGEDSSTPKVMVPPVTPDLPACSPASETGSENSVNMAAHTLMILSRAAISRTTSTTPLKDNTQQFRASSRSTTKKRKIEELDERERHSRTSNKSLANSSIPMKKKKIKKKKLPSSFPAGMDVDKFLLSLHYDE
ncbi:protein NPAT isoform X2 [Physeter macrocephalus]|uniref:Protein NPAT isoform X2 n=1 Tax=Physeter macrocephalus TaxID=9755 RepID=A0A455C5X6_PHYMC|nr:protein NPAT isoform X2 [Physeter catodon]|eukprot:XP_028356824.1 protein NPAT isoform X3 [Physeter catodon]